MERVLLADGVEDINGKTVFKGLFGDDLVIVADEQEKVDIPIASKLTKREHDALEGWAYKFGMSKMKFIRHCILQQIKELTMLSNP